MFHPYCWRLSERLFENGFNVAWGKAHSCWDGNCDLEGALPAGPCRMAGVKSAFWDDDGVRETQNPTFFQNESSPKSCLWCAETFDRRSHNFPLLAFIHKSQLRPEDCICHFPLGRNEPHRVPTQGRQMTEWLWFDTPQPCSVFCRVAFGSIWGLSCFPFFSFFFLCCLSPCQVNSSLAESFSYSWFWCCKSYFGLLFISYFGFAKYFLLFSIFCIFFKYFCICFKIFFIIYFLYFLYIFYLYIF